MEWKGWMKWFVILLHCDEMIEPGERMCRCGETCLEIKLIHFLDRMLVPRMRPGLRAKKDEKSDQNR